MFSVTVRDHIMFALPALTVVGQRCLQLLQALGDVLGALSMADANGFFAQQDVALGAQQCDFALNGLNMYRSCMLR